ncbi:MAG: RICIN domain-containing protein [Ktedonobacteraceae bacterium]|nr:RICIN domain-containing protein [Ktedonobacteraceae bacterium]
MANPIEGVSFYIRSQLGNLVLDVQGGKTDPGTPVIVYSQGSSAANNQLWTIESVIYAG